MSDQVEVGQVRSVQDRSSGGEMIKANEVLEVRFEVKKPGWRDCLEVKSG